MKNLLKAKTKKCPACKEKGLEVIFEDSMYVKVKCQLCDYGHLKTKK